MIAERKAALRESVGKMAARIIPDLDERLWNAQRDRLARRARKAGPTRSTSRSASSTEPHLLIVTTGDGPEAPSWRPAQGNHIFEVTQTAIDLLGTDRVTVEHVRAGEAPGTWHPRIIDRAQAVGATHLLANVETDPHDAHEWTWDLFTDRLRLDWPGVFIALTYDSAFDWTTIRVKRLARRDARTLVVALDRPLADVLPGPRAHVGPVLLPISLPTQAVLGEALPGLSKQIPVSFIGALYDYRVPVLERLRSAGVDVEINPQRPDVTTDYVESRTAQPGYLAYMTALASSEITINLSRAHTEPTQQLKTRVLEGSLAGCVVATDDADRSDRFFTEGTEFVRVRSVDDAATVIPALLADHGRLRALQAAAQSRARQIADTVFWDAVDAGLRSSSMTPLLTRVDAR